ncbi:acyl-CoA dehydrogenase family protein [Glacieibacterium frigidum]|uniref:Acyl-CoA dehydrogenase n=1 Tax=Glacieibacterium frigidum TaxID=2593303 RepID=A0A552U9S2_9SPHN|nr:acyl-CoA dehydrogenase [Glacieibacterium frigidum]TRW14958.1 acyl-CoA dehydrogenase [Glacieibacterium frigidum]
MRNAWLPSDVPDPDHALEAVAVRIWQRAAAVDAAAAFPAKDIADLVTSGTIAACADLLDDNALPILSTIGAASLTVGRLFEGHLNAVKLANRYGDAEATDIVAAEIAAGRILGVWNAERGGGVTATRIDGGYRLDGGKVHCSGAGTIRRPVVTASLNGDTQMFLPDLVSPRVGIDLAIWRAAGMRGTATGSVTFDGLEVPDAAVLGSLGDYYRSPWFSGGAWRVIAVQLGALDRIMALHADRLRDDPVARARFAAAAGAHEAARLHVREAARRAETPNSNPEEIDAYVDLARGTFETAALTIIEATRRNVGLSSFIAPDPLDRCLRDLETYLRQPFLDASRDHAARWLAARGGRFSA